MSDTDLKAHVATIVHKRRWQGVVSAVGKGMTQMLYWEGPTRNSIEEAQKDADEQLAKMDTK